MHQTSELEQKLAEINAAIAAKLEAGEVNKTAGETYACPIDPAERAQCEGCQ
jgi:hypothetical protein